MNGLGVIVESISSLKVLGSLLVNASNHNITPVVFMPEYRKGKPYDTITPALLLQAFPNLTAGNIHTYAAGQLVASASAHQAQVICLLNPYRNFAQAVIELRQKNIPVVGLDYFINSIYVTASGDDPAVIRQSLTDLTARLVASDFWRDLEMKVQPDHRSFADKFYSVGSPLLDAFVDVTTEQAYQRLALPTNKKIISVFTPNIRDHQAYFFYGPATMYALLRLARLLRHYCDQRGYYLVVKSRAKQWDAAAFLNVADQAILDIPDQIYPPTSTLLLKVSSLALHFGSMTVLESAGNYVPVIAFAPEKIDKLHTYMRPAARQLLKKAILSQNQESLMNYDHVSRSFSIWPNYQEFSTAADRMIDTPQPSRYRAFNKKYSGWQPERSASDRILEFLTYVHP